MTRYARVSLSGSTTVEMVARYLPSNYAVLTYNDEHAVIGGEDFAGWTLDDYVIPRLRSGLIAVKEVDPDEEF
jgi:hypothetical protein